ncbi:hypothetical protein [Sporisorium scitamineum]|uniref:Uncharacterized protein n=2 Tax=Sporisorium scitamineum TaxID=49012 RepID=A0A0F7RU68_9BASI|nr:hypothetical protein [Sporisorium scitamineum]
MRVDPRNDSDNVELTRATMFIQLEDEDVALDLRKSEMQVSTP